MITLLKLLGWTLRVSAFICITYVVVSVARGAERYAEFSAILMSVAWHAAFAVGGVQLLGLARRLEASRRARASVAVAEAAAAR